MSSNSNRYKRISNNKFINKEIITNNKHEKNSPNNSKPRTKITINKSLLWKEKEKDKEENKNKNNINNINKNSKINLIKNISLSKLKNNSIETNNNTKTNNKINNNNKLLLDNKIDTYQKKYMKLNLTDRKKEDIRSPNSEDNQKSEQNNKYTPTTQSTQKENNNFSAREFKHTSYRFLLHHASKNLNNTFSKIYNPNNRSFSNSLNKSINSNNNDNQLNHYGNNKSSADIFENNNKNIFKDKQELNRIAFNQNNLIKSQSNNNFNKFKKRMVGNISLRNFTTENNNEVLNDSFNSQNNNLIYDNYNKNININQYNTNDNSYSNNNNKNNINMNNSSSNFYHNYLDNNNHQRVFSFLNNNKINNNNNKYFLFNNNLKEKYFTENQILFINLDNLLILQNKLDFILNKLNEFTPCSNEVYEWIKYYFENSIYDNLITFFKDSNNRNIFINFIKIELLCYCLCYETSVDLNLNKVCIVLKSIFNLIHFNYLIIIRFVLHNTQMTSENYVWYEKLFNIVKSNLQINLNKNELDEFNIIKILNYNIKGILDYYKMIIDNLYIINYHSEIRQFSFPYCLSFQNLKNTKKKELISSFFFEGYKNLDNYDIKDIHIFFNQILNENNEVSPIISFKIKFNEDINNNNNINNYSYRKNNNNNKEYYNYNDYDEKNINENMCCYSERLYNSNNKNVNISSYEDDNNNEINYNIININYKNISDDNNNNDNKYIYNRRNSNSILNNINNNYISNNTTKISLKYLPNLNVRLYKYTLCLELDNSLVYILNENGSNSMILRPNLYEFLKKMKKIYELVLFSFGSPEYVDPIVNAIEKNEKYFEHRLYKQHCVLYGNEYVKDLSKIGRDLKKTLIVDILSKNFRLQIDNGICMKAFYGDCRKDKNTLKLLSNVLEDIKYDADKTNDIRLSLKKKENFIISKIGY